MSFLTKIDLSNNIFVKQKINSITNFDGINNFSVPLEQRVLGPNLEKVIRNIIKTNITTSFTYNKKTLSFSFEDEVINEYAQYISPEITPYDNDIEIKTPYTGIDPYQIMDVEFFKHYTWNEIDFNFEIVDENDDFIIGNSFSDKLNECISESLDYNGDNIVVNINGGIKCDFLNSKTNYTIENISHNYTLNILSNILYIYQSGDITIDEDTEIGWNAFIYSNIKINFTNENVEFLNEDNPLKEIIKISKDKYIIK